MPYFESICCTNWYLNLLLKETIKNLSPKNPKCFFKRNTKILEILQKNHLKILRKNHQESRDCTIQDFTAKYLYNQRISRDIKKTEKNLTMFYHVVNLTYGLICLILPVLLVLIHPLLFSITSFLLLSIPPPIYCFWLYLWLSNQCTSLKLQYFLILTPLMVASV